MTCAGNASKLLWLRLASVVLAIVLSGCASFKEVSAFASLSVKGAGYDAVTQDYVGAIDRRKQYEPQKFQAELAVAIGMVLDENRAPLSRLKSSVKQAESAIQHIKSFKKALDLASALALLAAAIASGNVAEIPVALVALEDATEAIVSSGGSDES